MDPPALTGTLTIVMAIVKCYSVHTPYTFLYHLRVRSEVSGRSIFWVPSWFTS